MLIQPALHPYKDFRGNDETNRLNIVSMDVLEELADTNTVRSVLRYLIWLLFSHKMDGTVSKKRWMVLPVYICVCYLPVEGLGF